MSTILLGEDFEKMTFNYIKDSYKYLYGRSHGVKKRAQFWSFNMECIKFISIWNLCAIDLSRWFLRYFDLCGNSIKAFEMCLWKIYLKSEKLLSYYHFRLSLILWLKVKKASG